MTLTHGRGQEARLLKQVKIATIQISQEIQLSRVDGGDWSQLCFRLSTAKIIGCQILYVFHSGKDFHPAGADDHDFLDLKLKYFVEFRGDLFGGS